MRKVSNSTGLERTIKALKPQLDLGDEALLALARGLAAAVDAEPNNAALWREYRAAVADLRAAGAEIEVDDDARDFQLAICTPLRTAVGDTPQP